MKLRYAKANIRRVFSLRTALEEREGIGWYREARRELQAASDAAGVPLEVAAHITAALSPNIRWGTNLAATKKALEVVGQPNWREALEGLTLAGFAKNSTKAKDILIAWVEGRDWAGILSGPKVRAFADSLIGRPDAEVVVDVHAYSVAVNRRWTVKTIPGISNLRRRIVSDAYRAVAKEAGLSPAEVQAVTWVTWRRLHKV
jgi:hypothetical protein